VQGASSNISTRAVSLQVRLARHLIQRRSTGTSTRLRASWEAWTILSQMEPRNCLDLQNNVAGRDRKNSAVARGERKAQAFGRVLGSHYCVAKRTGVVCSANAQLLTIVKTSTASPVS